MDQGQDLKVSSNAADSAADNTDPLRPRFSLTANKCESNGSEQSFQLMIFGGIPENECPAIAETKLLTLGEHDYSKEELGIIICMMSSLAPPISYIQFVHTTQKLVPF